MLGSMLRQLCAKWRSSAAFTAVDRDAESLRSQVRAALIDLLREGPRPTPPIDYEQVAYVLAAASSARYFMRRMPRARNLRTRVALLEFALDACEAPGLMLEFGVYRGESLRFIAQRTPQLVHGFDSFEGLPEDWTHFQRKGRFSLDGQVPRFEEQNIRVHPGWFSATLPPFLAEESGAVRFAHIDCDLYSSTADVLALLGPRIVRGSILVFDEYLNYPNWRQHEYRAFQEFVSREGREYEYIGFASSHYSVAVRMR